MKIRAEKDFWSGVMFLGFALVAIAAARGYSMGSGGKMGPGYFPMLLGIALAGLGALLVGRSLVLDGVRVTRLQVRPTLMIVLGVILFGLMIPYLGLVIALATVTAVSAFASRESRPLEVAALAAVLAAFSVGIFVYALRLPLTVWPAL
jgi:Tripartite tricarboxylate transporter TctB family